MMFASKVKEVGKEGSDGGLKPDGAGAGEAGVSNLGLTNDPEQYALSKQERQYKKIHKGFQNLLKRSGPVCFCAFLYYM